MEQGVPAGSIPAAFWATAIPTIEGPESLTRTFGYTTLSSGEYTVTSNPAPSVGQSTTHGGAIAWNPTDKTLDIDEGLDVGTYTVYLTATNSQGSDTASFTLTVVPSDGRFPDTGDTDMLALVIALFCFVDGTLIMTARRKSRKPHVSGNYSV